MPLKRRLCPQLIKELSRREIGVIIGPRQVGKTTLLREIQHHCEKKKTPCKYFDLEMPSDAHFFARPFQSVLEDLNRERQTVLIDEFHYLPNATKLFKTIYDGYKGLKVFASGSSALEMHKHMKESLAGRRRIYRVYPLSFSEWLPSRASRIKLPQNFDTKISATTHQTLRKHLENFVIFGGMPGLVHEKTEEDKKRLLLDLVATYIQKDIKALLREEDILSFNRLLVLLAGQEGNLLSEIGVSRDLNYSLRQVRKDVSILSQMFLLDVLKPFFTNRGRELKQTNKIYFFDTGIRNAILRDFRPLRMRPDKGVLLESFVLHEIQKNMKVSQDIYYWRTREKEEVDFILIQDRIPIPIEVKSSLIEGEIPQGLRQFLRKYPECQTAVILSDNLLRETRFENKRLLYAPHYLASLIPLLYEKVKITRLGFSSQ